MQERRLFPKTIIKYISIRFFKSLFLCLIGLSSIYLLVEFFEYLDNLLAQHIPFKLMFQYLFFRSFPIIFQILPVAILMATLLTLGGMAKDGEVLVSFVSGISLYQMIIPLLLIFIGLTILSGFFQETVGTAVSQKALILRATIRGQKPQKKLAEGKIWFAGKQGRFFYLHYVDLKARSLNSVTIFEMNESFQLQERWDIKKCYYRDEQWYLHDVYIRRFQGDRCTAESVKERVVSWPEKFSDFASLQKTPQEMSYFELKEYIQRLEEWGYKTFLQRTDLYFKWAFPFTCLIFGLLGIPFSLHLHRGVRYLSLGFSIVISFIYWVIMYLGVSIAHKGIVPPVIGAWIGNIIFGLLVALLILKIRT